MLSVLFVSKILITMTMNDNDKILSAMTGLAFQSSASPEKLRFTSRIGKKWLNSPNIASTKSSTLGSVQYSSYLIAETEQAKASQQSYSSRALTSSSYPVVLRLKIINHKFSQSNQIKINVLKKMSVLPFQLQSTDSRFWRVFFWIFEKYIQNCEACVHDRDQGLN